MANLRKEEERNEKIIRGLLKLPSNKRCINCNSMGPQYVCTNFWTFICTNCSGLHREFTHRVKSISMAKFTSREVSALQEGGNERAREIFFKEWDPQLYSYPDSSHLDRLRDFIQNVYVERKYAGGNNIDGPPRVKGEQEEDYVDNRSSNTHHSGSRSPSYNDPYERRYGETPGSAGNNDDRNSRCSYETRSPSYDHGDCKGFSHFEMRNEIRQDDKAVNEVQSSKSYEYRVSDGLPKPGVSDHQKGVYISSPPMVRQVRDILGGDVSTLWVGGPPKMKSGKAPNSTLEKQLHPSASLQGFLPNTSNPSSLPNNYKLTGIHSQWSSPLPGPYMMKQFPNVMPHQLPSSFFPAMNQGAGVVSEPISYCVKTSNQLPAQATSHLGSLNSSVPSIGRNPFG